MFRAALESCSTCPSSATCAATATSSASSWSRTRRPSETFNDDESERLLRGFLSKALFDAGLYCRADDRGDPVVQLAPPLTIGPSRVRRDRGHPARCADRGVVAALTRSVRPEPLDRFLQFWRRLASGTSGGGRPAPARRPSPAVTRMSTSAIVGGGLDRAVDRLVPARARSRAHASPCSRRRSPASGRRGATAAGASALFPSSTASLERRTAVTRPSPCGRAMIDTVDEVGRVAGAEGIDCDFVRGGTVAYARSARAARGGTRRGGRGRGVRRRRARALGRADRGSARAAGGALGAVFDPACARLHPAKLVRGLAEAVEGRGVHIAERPRSLDWSPAVRSAAGSTAPSTGRSPPTDIVVAPKATARRCRGDRRRILPLYSLMIATEPLPDASGTRSASRTGRPSPTTATCSSTGSARPTTASRSAAAARATTGAARSGRSTIASRASSTTCGGRSSNSSPPSTDAAVTHRWGGRSGCPATGTRPRATTRRPGSRWPAAMSATGSARRTSPGARWPTDAGMTGPLTELPWVNHRSPRWEPEPLRFVGANLGLLATGLADAEDVRDLRDRLLERACGTPLGSRR